MPTKYSIIELIAVFTALTIVLGFTFFIGFCWQLDWRFFQFMTPSDYVTVATSYVFAVPLSVLAYTRMSYSDYDPDMSFFRSLNKWLHTEFVPISKEEAKYHLLGTRIARYLIIFPAIPILLGPIAILVHWQIIGPHSFVFLLVVSSLPYTIFTCVHSMALERKSAERRAIGLKGLIIVSFLIVLSYGLFQGGRISDSTTKNVTITELDGTKITGVFVYHFAYGVALKQPRSPTITFLPDTKTSRLELDGS